MKKRMKLFAPHEKSYLILLEDIYYENKKFES